MCGIAGVLSSKLSPTLAQTLVDQMCGLLSHRGPDEWGTYVGPSVALCNTRLSIVDLSTGHQPMCSDRYVVVYNGEIYNHIELRQDLEHVGVRFRTTSDTEVVLHSYAQWGPSAFRLFNGQFAILIWDKAERELTAVRDRYGVRPLYVLVDGGCTYFASETKAFDAIPGYRRRFDVGHLFEHALLWNTIGDETVFQGIRSVQSGTYEIHRLSGPPQIRRYYTLGEEVPAAPRSFDEAREQLIELLTDSVRLRLRSDVPVGAYLSGGIDSSVVTLLASRLNPKGLKTFSVAFEDPAYDESGAQQQMVRHLGTDHHALTVDYEAINSTLLDAVYHFERPVFRTAPAPLYLLSALARENGIRVVLTGEASDEILYGYDSYKELNILRFWKRNPASRLRPLLIKRLYPHLSHYSDERQYGLMVMYYEGFLQDFDNRLASLNIRVRNNSVIRNYFRKEHDVVFDPGVLLDKLAPTLPAGYDSWTLLQRNQFQEMSTLLSGYLLSSQGDRMSLAHGVEGRYPFLDHRLVDAVFGYPDSYKLSGFRQKHILREAFRADLPQEIVDRAKVPYQAPDRRSFVRNGRLTEIAGDFLSPRMVERYGVFEPSAVGRYLKRAGSDLPAGTGYRDNMLMVFMLTTQMAAYWMENRRPAVVPSGSRVARISEAG